MSDFDEQEIEVEAEEVLISQEPVELYKVLKLANVVDGGGQAKHLIGEGYVAVNGELEHRKRRKTYDGDVVQVGEQFFVVMLADEETIAAANAFEETTFEGDFVEQDAELLAEEESTSNSSLATEIKRDDEPADSLINSNNKPEPKEPGSKGRKSIDFF